MLFYLSKIISQKMEKKNVYRVIILSILVAYTVYEVAEEPNHLFAESSQEVTGFKSSSERYPDVPLRSRMHKFPVQISTTAHSFSSDNERVGSTDGRLLPASKNAQKSMKWTKHDKIRNVSTMRKLKVAMRRSARQHDVLHSSHGTGMHASISILKDNKEKEAFTFQKTPQSSFMGLPYKTKITAPFKLMILPTEERVIPSVDTADTESDWLSKEDNTTKQDDQKFSRGDDKEGRSSPHGEPKVNGREGSTPKPGTSAMSQHKMAAHAGVKASSGLRWKAAYDLVKLDDSKKGKHFKYKKKKSHSEDEEPVDTSSPRATAAGILAGILMLLFIFTGVPRLWKILKKCWKRRTYHRLGSNFPSTGYCSEEFSEEEIIFDRSVMERNKESSEDASPSTTPEASSGTPQSASSLYQSPDHPRIWTLTNTPRSTSLMGANTLDDSFRTEAWTSKEITESRSLEFWFPSTGLSDAADMKPTETLPSESLTSASLLSQTSETEMCDSELETRSSAPICDLTDKTLLSPSPLTTEGRLGPSLLFEQTSSESSLSPHPSKPSFSSMSTASDESTLSIPMASDSASSSKESCKTPAAARNVVVTTMDDNDKEIIHPSDKSECEVLNAANNACKGSSKEEAVITIGLDDEEESSVKSESESFREEVIKKSKEAEMKDTTTGDAIIDITGSDNDNEETSVINEKSNDGRTQPRDAVKHEAKREVRWEDKSRNPEDAGASTSSSAKIRVMNHKDYKTWKELQKDIEMKKGQRTKPRDVLPGLQVIRDIYNLPRIPVDSEGGCLCYYCEKHIRRARRDKFFKIPGKLFSFKLKSAANEALSGSESSSTSSAAKIRVMNHKDYKTWKGLQKDIKMKKAQGIKPRDVLPGLQIIRDIYNLPRIPVDSEGGCLCYYCEKHIRRARREKFFKLPRFDRQMACA